MATEAKPEFLTRAEAAKLARVNEATLRRWADQGRPVGRVRQVGRVLYVREKLVAFLRGDAAEPPGK